MPHSQSTGLSPFLPVIVIPAHLDVIDTEGGKRPVGTHAAPMPSADDPKTFGAYIADRMDFMGPQKNAEEALLTATRPPAERGARRPRVTRSGP
jgi:hypothetical protein